MDGTTFAFDPDWVSTLNAPFMTNAFLACFRRSWRVRSWRSTGDRCARQEGFTA